MLHYCEHNIKAFVTLTLYISLCQTSEMSISIFKLRFESDTFLGSLRANSDPFRFHNRFFEEGDEQKSITKVVNEIVQQEGACFVTPSGIQLIMINSLK